MSILQTLKKTLSLTLQTQHKFLEFTLCSPRSCNNDLLAWRVITFPTCSMSFLKSWYRQARWPRGREMGHVTGSDRSTCSQRPHEPHRWGSAPPAGDQPELMFLQSLDLGGVPLNQAGPPTPTHYKVTLQPPTPTLPGCPPHPALVAPSPSQLTALRLNQD